MSGANLSNCRFKSCPAHLVCCFPKATGCGCEMIINGIMTEFDAWPLYGGGHLENGKVFDWHWNLNTGPLMYWSIDLLHETFGNVTTLSR